ncbi:type II toxin-antitoxin system mRNA interferase toxin, RelE/StbE family [candidate division WWE3 bacterium CG10_big_fil_rev_8_21_14_0_10_35_32]|nr:MAG: type II toxin-antitoxin system mRNA interferase toxin, RelE/StbE family [candidate division WWE3 bacterium CG10_big_fil_rev_8_21_14_0_10_35_32]
MKVVLHKTFVKNFDKRIKPSHNLCIRFRQRLSLFVKDSKNPVLKDHALIGRLLVLRSFSISGDIRVVYRKITHDCVEFMDIGTHPQVYR